MTEHINHLKLAVTACCAALTTLWGWFGWLCLALAACMALDYITGTLAAKATGTWSSAVARSGLWHKLAIIVAVLAACILDAVVGSVVNNIPGITLPWSYTVIFAPLVVVWYILTELGSILENSGKLGGPQPKWFQAAVRALTGAVDKSAPEDGKD